jgi:hypothetical protein
MRAHFQNIAERAANYLNVRPDILPVGSIAVMGNQVGNRPAGASETRPEYATTRID